MAFNSGQTYKDMLVAAQLAAGNHWGILQAPFEQVMEQQRERIREISGDWIRSGTSDKVLDAQLEELQHIFRLVFEKNADIDIEIAKKASKAAINCLWEALMAAL